MTRDAGEVRWGGGQLVEVCDGADEGGEPGGGTGEAGGGGEVVLGHDFQGVRGELGQRGVGGLELGTESAQLAEAGLGAGARDVLRGAIEEERVFFGVRGRARGGGVGAEVGLREGDGEGGIGGEVELCVALAPIFDHGDVDGRRRAGAVDV